MREAATLAALVSCQPAGSQRGLGTTPPSYPNPPEDMAVQRTHAARARRSFLGPQMRVLCLLALGYTWENQARRKRCLTAPGMSGLELSQAAHGIFEECQAFS